MSASVFGRVREIFARQLRTIASEAQHGIHGKGDKDRDLFLSIGGKSAFRHMLLRTVRRSV